MLNSMPPLLNGNFLAASALSPDPMIQILTVKIAVITLLVSAIAFAAAVVADAWLGSPKL